MNIPSKKECFKLIKDMKMMDHIIDHSIMVSNVALFLSLKLKKVCPTIDTHLAMSAALLHDITKTRSFETNEIHSETGAIILTDMGYPEVGDIIRQHVILDSYETQSPISEQEIVNYSDKRILHDQVVSLKERMEYIQLRYGVKNEFKERFREMKTNSIALEKKIFNNIDIEPIQLSEQIKREIKKEDWT